MADLLRHQTIREKLMIWSLFNARLIKFQGEITFPESVPSMLFW